MNRSVRIKSTDNAKQVARDKRRRNRLNSIKVGLEMQNTKNFDQIFAIISESRLATETGISFYTFRNKVKNPELFSYGDTITFAALFGVTYHLMHNFILNQIKERNKSKIFNQ